ncbi:MAG: DUF3105 domain-containing protein [Actinobacteria bacterium]|nr:DUF3105 domain-containing protein [Actinomycetota bacterium]
MPTGAEERLARRRVARAERDQERRRRRTVQWIAAGVGLFAVVAVVILVLVVTRTGEAPASQPGAAGTTASASPRVRLPDQGAAHVPVGDPIQYASTPPASGTHYSTTAPYGVHRESILPGYWVHNLEHGAVVLLFRCAADCDPVVQQITELYKRLPNGAFGEVKLVAAPDPALSTAFVLIAWRVQEALDAFDAARIEAFYRDFVDKGPERAP